MVLPSAAVLVLIGFISVILRSDVASALITSDTGIGVQLMI